MAESKKPVGESEATEAADTKAAAVTASGETSATESGENETKKAEPKKRGRKPGSTNKTEPKKRGRKPAAEKKETTKTTTTRKAAVKTAVHVQFMGKSYSAEELVQTTKDIWKNDLKRKVGDFKSVELYVKPEESIVYYVINGEERGHFNI